MCIYTRIYTRRYIYTHTHIYVIIHTHAHIYVIKEDLYKWKDSAHGSEDLLLLSWQHSTN